MSAAADHLLYTTADNDKPRHVCDRNGEVVLSQCKLCGKAEIELDGPCTPVTKRAQALPGLLEELAFETKTYDEEGYTLNPDAAVVFDQIKRHIAALAAAPVGELRDTFAAAALAKIIDGVRPAPEIARMAYQMADEMLKARQQ